MKNSAKYPSLVLAAGTAGVAFFAAANSNFTSLIGGDLDVAVAAIVAVALVGLAVYDYSRRSRCLVAPARLLRPVLPASVASSKTIAYRAKSPRTRRLAA
jgi:hypothetical protein